MKLVVDLTRCQGYAQCAYLAPSAFTMHGDEALLYDPDPSDDQRERVLRAAAACPVQAIVLGPEYEMADVTRERFVYTKEMLLEPNPAQQRPLIAGFAAGEPAPTVEGPSMTDQPRPRFDHRWVDTTDTAEPPS